MHRACLFILLTGILFSACTDTGGNNKITSDIFIKNETSHRALVDFSGVQGLGNSKLVVLLESGELYKTTRSGYAQDFDPFSSIRADSVFITFDDTLSIAFSVFENDCLGDTAGLNPLCPDAWNYTPVEKNSYYSTQYALRPALYELAK